MVVRSGMVSGETRTRHQVTNREVFLARHPYRTLIALCLCGVLFAQGAQNVDSQSDRQGRIDSLKKELRAIKKIDRKDDYERLQVQLAQMGETVQLQQILCELDFGDPPAVRINALGRLRSVGGWFSINSAAKFLGDDPAYLQPHSDPYAMPPPLRFFARENFPNWLKNPPRDKIQIKYPPQDTAKEAQIWREWLQKNHDSLSKLQPVGEGLVSSEGVCREVLKHDLV